MKQSPPTYLYQLLQLTPWIMLVIRIFIALALFFDALDSTLKTSFVPALVIAVTLDISDGMVARRLGVASLQLRRVDSFADFVLFYSVSIAAWLTYGELMRPFAYLFALVIFFHLADGTVNAIKFKALPAYHTWGSRITGALMFLAAIQLFVLQGAGLLIFIALLASCVSCLEIIFITLTLPEVYSDVSGIFHARRYRHQYLSHLVPQS